MHIHNVYIWLKDHLNQTDVTAFEQNLKALIDDPCVQSGYYGKPAATDRPVVENTYAYGLVLIFEDLAAHDRHQKGSAHMQLVAQHRDKWTKVIVHDIETRS